MATFTEGLRNSECLVSEANGGQSREKIIIGATAGVINANTPLGKQTANGKCYPYAPGASDGTQNFYCIGLEYVDATTVDQPSGALVRACEVNSGELDYRTLTTAQITTLKAAMVAATVIPRDPIG